MEDIYGITATDEDVAVKREEEAKRDFCKLSFAFNWGFIDPCQISMASLPLMRMSLPRRKQRKPSGISVSLAGRVEPDFDPNTNFWLDIYGITATDEDKMAKRDAEEAKRDFCE